jgi:hypothetical protein
MTAEHLMPTRDFANDVLGDWEAAMDRFFEAVERKMRARDLKPSDVRDALDAGYGAEVAEAWDEWAEEWVEET